MLRLCSSSMATSKREINLETALQSPEVGHRVGG